MAIAYRSTSTPVTSASRTTTTVSMPSGVQAGDVVLIYVSAGASAAVSVTPPASTGAHIATVDYSAPDPWVVRLRVYKYTVVGTGDPSTFAFTHTSASTDAAAVAFSGVHATTPIDGTPVTNFKDFGPSTAPTFATYTTTVNDVELVGWRGSWDGNAITAPASWTERVDQPVTWLGHRPWPTAGATGAISVTSGNGDPNSPWGTILVPLRPATGGGSTAGTLSASLPRATSAITGAVQTGTVAGSLPRMTSAIAGTVTQSGTVSASLPPLTGAIAGAVQTGTVSASLPRATAAISGNVGAAVAATLTGVLARATAALTGTVTAQGTVSGALPRITATVPDQVAAGIAATLPVVTGTLAGTVTFPATVSGSLARVTGAVAGDVLGPVTGSLVGTLAAVTGSVSGQVRILGTTSGSLPLIRMSQPLMGVMLNLGSLTGLLPLVSARIREVGNLRDISPVLLTVSGSPVHVRAMAGNGVRINSAEGNPARIIRMEL